METNHKKIKIGGASAMWGDSLFSVRQLLQSPDLNYILLEGLAEITMGILSRVKTKIPDKGYAVDFIDPILKTSLPDIAAKGIKVVTNAGGVNPIGAAQHLREICKEQGLSLKIAAVTGDDVYSFIEEYRKREYKDIDGQRTLPTQDILSMNAYLGAFPIAQALKGGADIVVTGRCADSALALGPLIYEFGWEATQLDYLAQGSLAGHLLECGAQVTGGIMTDWETSGSWANMGYPIAECSSNGDFCITKLPGTSGIINEASVSEQLVYEIGDPHAYILPDVVCDFTQVTLEQIEKDIVLVQGARGKLPTPTYKAIAQCQDGYRATYVFMITGRDLKEKSERLMKDTRQRIEKIYQILGFEKFKQFDVELLGTESNFGENAQIIKPRELIIKLAVHHAQKPAIDVLSRELPSLAVSSIQSFCTGITGRQSASPLLRPLSYLVEKREVDPGVRIFYSDKEELFNPPATLYEVVKKSTGDIVESHKIPSDWVYVPLYSLAYARSGDKGDSANIGVIARSEEFYEFLSKWLSPEMVKQYFKHFVKGEVYRYRLPGIKAFNFLMSDALGGGGAASLRFDAQGKGLGQNLLEMQIAVPKEILAHPQFKNLS